MPTTIITKERIGIFSIFGGRLKTIYSERDKAFKKLSRKLHMNLFVKSKTVLNTCRDLDNGDLYNVVFLFHGFEYRITTGTFTIYIFKRNVLGEEMMIGMVPIEETAKVKSFMMYHTILSGNA